MRMAVGMVGLVGWMGIMVMVISIEHAYRQSSPDSYGMGMNGMMGGGGINNLPGSAVSVFLKSNEERS
jgi:hypothetical protein